MLGRIYLITNLINGKRYVGQTIKPNSEASRKKNSESHIGTQTGEKHPRSKLTEKDVLEIRAAVINGISRAAIAKQYNVGITAIDKIVNRHTWRHI